MDYQVLHERGASKYIREGLEIFARKQVLWRVGGEPVLGWKLIK